MIALRDNLAVVNCQKCGYAHLLPLPKGKNVTRYYGDEDQEYGSIAGMNWLVEQDIDHKKGLWDSRYAFERSLIGVVVPLLDIGAGAGHFVAWWQTNVGDAQGVEPSATARQWAKSMANIELFSSRVQVKSQFKAMRFCLVLEHLVKPAEVLVEYLPLLEPKGRVLIVVPNEFNSLQQRLRKRLGDWFIAPQHVNYFTPLTLTTMLESLGLIIEAQAVTFPTEVWRLLGCNSERAGRWCHALRLQLERLCGPRLFRLYQRLYKRYGWGREIIVVARKR